MLLLNLEPMKFSQDAITALEKVIEYRPLSEQAAQNAAMFWEEVSAADIVWTRLGRRLDEAFFDRASHLQAVVTPTTGLNHIDLQAAASRGIEVVSLKGDTQFLSTITSTAELTLSLLLEAMRHTGRAHHATTRDFEWNRDRFRGRQLSGQTLGIIGMGRLGRIVAEYATALRLKVQYCDTRLEVTHPPHIAATRIDLDSLLSTSDIVSLHADYRPENHHMLAEREFGLMQAHAWLINTARGELVDEVQLLAALEASEIAGAALDVLENENRVALELGDHPLISYAARNDNLIITPHIGGACDDAMAATELHVAEKLIAKLTKERDAEPGSPNR